MWLMLQQPSPDDFVVGTGIAHSVRDFVSTAFNHIGLAWQKYVVTDPRFMRPAEVEFLLANKTKAETVLKWKPEVDFTGLVKMMVDADIERLTKTKG
jgi:GDPmannose 4,6-dehydratase